MSSALDLLQSQIPWLHARLREAGLASLTDVAVVDRRLGTRLTTAETGLETVRTTYSTKDYVEQKKTEAITAAFGQSQAGWESALTLYASKEYALALKAEALSAATEYTDGQVSEISKVFATKDFVEATKTTTVEAAVKDATKNIRALVTQNLSAYASKDYVESTITSVVVAQIGDLEASIEEETAARVASDGRLSAKWSLTATAGDVVTGLELVSAIEGAGRTVSRFRVQADKFELRSSSDGTAGVAPFDVDLGTGIVSLNTALVVNGTPLSLIRNNALVPPLNYIGAFATAPDPASHPTNSVYRNTTDGNTYVRTSISTWALYLEKGQVGAAGSAIYATITAPSQVFKAPASGVYTPSSITLTAALVGATATAYSWDFWNGSTWINLTGEVSATLVVSNSSFTGSRTFRAAVTHSGGTEYDEYTLVKLIDGVGAYNAILTNQSVSVGFSALDAPLTGELGVSGGALGKGFTDVIAFSGTTALTATASSSPGAGFFYISLGTQTDGTFFKYDNDTVHCTAIAAGKGSAQCVINVNCEGTVIPLRFSVSKAKAGSDGSPGTPGSAAVSVDVTAPSQVFKSVDGVTYTPSTLTLSAFLTNASPSTYFWEYWTGSAWTPAGSTSSTLVVSNSAFTGARTYRCGVTWSTGGPYYDSITLAKLTDGVNGSSPYQAILTNEAHTIGYDPNENPYAGELGPPGTGKAWTDVLAFKGTTALTAVSSSPTTGQFSAAIAAFLDGTFVKHDFDTFYANAMVPGKFSGYLDIAINCEGVTTITKRFSIAKSKSGANGERGSKQFYRVISGSSWSNTEAEAAVVASGFTKVLLDQVTLSNPAAGYAETRYWAGPTSLDWLEITAVINGNLLVNGAIGAEKLSSSFVLATKVDIGTGPLRTQIDSTNGARIGNLTINGFFNPSIPSQYQQQVSIPGRFSMDLFGGFVGSSVTLKDSASTYFYQLAHDGLGASLTANSSDRLRLERLGTLWNTPNGFRVGGTFFAAGASEMATVSATRLQKPSPDGYGPVMWTGTNEISFKWVGTGLKVKIDGTEFSVTLGPP